MSSTFRGGVHMNDHKSLTNKKTIQKVLADCPIHIFPLRQHIGAPLSPIVKPGDAVKLGQKIADAEAYMAVPIHSSISGKVLSVKPWIHPSGSMVDAIFIENDGAYTPSENIKPIEDYTKLTSVELLWTIREAGMVGLGGAGFPTHVKLAPPEGCKIDYLIINGAECEPYLTSDHRRMLEYPDSLIDGVKIVMHILGLKKAYIGIESNKRDVIIKLKDLLGKDSPISVMDLKPKYPQGAEKQLIKAITGRSVPPGKLPADAGAVVINADTTISISQAIREGKPVIERVVTLSGDCMNNPGNYSVPTGVPISFLVEQTGGFRQEPQKIIMGGPMMGLAQHDMEVPITKTSSAILALSKADEIYDPKMPCIKCGKCVDHCPMHLMPLYLSKYSLAKDYDAVQKYHIMNCIECGVCSYICPAKKNMLANIRVAKQEINKRKKQGGKK